MRPTHTHQPVNLGSVNPLPLSVFFGRGGGFLLSPAPTLRSPPPLQPPPNSLLMPPFSFSPPYPLPLPPLLSLSPLSSPSPPPPQSHTHSHTCTHARTHARACAHTHSHRTNTVCARTHTATAPILPRVQVPSARDMCEGTRWSPHESISPGLAITEPTRWAAAAAGPDGCGNGELHAQLVLLMVHPAHPHPTYRTHTAHPRGFQRTSTPRCRRRPSTSCPCWLIRFAALATTTAAEEGAHQRMSLQPESKAGRNTTEPTPPSAPTPLATTAAQRSPMGRPPSAQESPPCRLR